MRRDMAERVSAAARLARGVLGVALSGAAQRTASHELKAAAELVSTGQAAAQQRAVLESLRANSGVTSYELGAKMAEEFGGEVMFYRAWCSKRLPELERKGLAIRGERKRCSVSNRQAMTWKPT